MKIFFLPEIRICHFAASDSSPLVLMLCTTWKSLPQSSQYHPSVGGRLDVPVSLLFSELDKQVPLSCFYASCYSPLSYWPLLEPLQFVSIALSLEGLNLDTLFQMQSQDFLTVHFYPAV